jgi:hypothetical protein
VRVRVTVRVRVRVPVRGDRSFSARRAAMRAASFNQGEG